jgi:hypothetical protein
MINCLLHVCMHWCSSTGGGSRRLLAGEACPANEAETRDTLEGDFNPRNIAIFSLVVIKCSCSCHVMSWSCVHIIFVQWSSFHHRALHVI